MSALDLLSVGARAAMVYYYLIWCMCASRVPPYVKKNRAAAARDYSLHPGVATSISGTVAPSKRLSAQTGGGLSNTQSGPA